LATGSIASAKAVGVATGQGGSTSKAAHAEGYRAGGRAPEAHAALGAQAAPQGDVVQQRLAADEAETGQPPVPRGFHKPIRGVRASGGIVE
jgi:hypothetical protein